MKQIQHTDGSVEYTESDELIPIPAEPAIPAALREQAYRAEADQHLAAYTGYMLEGRTTEAGEQKASYLAKKTQIRERYPNIENN